MRRFRQLMRWLARAEDVMAELAIAVLVLSGASICVDVLMRYFFSRPILGSTELTEYALVYITFLGAAWGVPRGAHIDIDVLVNHVSERAQQILALTSHVIAFGVSVTLTVFGAWTTWTAYSRHLFKPTQLELPTWIVLVVIPIGCFVLSLRYLVEIALTAEAIATGEPMVKRERGPTID